MFENALLGRMISDGELCGYLSKFANAPAVFSELAPEGATTPYIVFSISRDNADTPSVESFSVFVDIYGGSESSRADNRRAAQRVEFLLDYAVLPQTDRYDTIRMFYESAAQVPDPDPRVVHYNLLFYARAGRKAWAQQI